MVNAPPRDRLARLHVRRRRPTRPHTGPTPRRTAYLRRRGRRHQSWHRIVAARLGRRRTGHRPHRAGTRAPLPCRSVRYVHHVPSELLAEVGGPGSPTHVRARYQAGCSRERVGHLVTRPGGSPSSGIPVFAMTGHLAGSRSLRSRRGVPARLLPSRPWQRLLSRRRRSWSNGGRPP